MVHIIKLWKILTLKGTTFAFVSYKKLFRMRRREEEKKKKERERERRKKEGRREGRQTLSECSFFHQLCD